MSNFWFCQYRDQMIRENPLSAVALSVVLYRFSYQYITDIRFRLAGPLRTRTERVTGGRWRSIVLGDVLWPDT